MKPVDILPTTFFSIWRFVRGLFIRKDSLGPDEIRQWVIYFGIILFLALFLALFFLGLKDGLPKTKEDHTKPAYQYAEQFNKDHHTEVFSPDDVCSPSISEYGLMEIKDGGGGSKDIKFTDLKSNIVNSENIYKSDVIISLVAKDDENVHKVFRNCNTWHVYVTE